MPSLLAPESMGQLSLNQLGHGGLSRAQATRNLGQNKGRKMCLKTMVVPSPSLVRGDTEAWFILLNTNCMELSLWRQKAHLVPKRSDGLEEKTTFWGESTYQRGRLPDMSCAPGPGSGFGAWAPARCRKPMPMSHVTSKTTVDLGWSCCVFFPLIQVATGGTHFRSYFQNKYS